MSDGSGEKTVEKSTEELLSETEDVLSGIDEGDDTGGSTGGRAGTDADGGTVDAGSVDAGGSAVDDGLGALEESMGAGESAGVQRDAASVESTKGTSVGSDDRGFRRYFDPASAGISAVVVLAGAILGGMIPIPFLGALASLLGVFGGTFVHGAGASESRYAETVVASAVVGVVFTILTSPVLSLSVGVPMLAISTGLIVVSGVAGHYFGRDLRAGLTGDVDGGGPGGSDDVPDW